MGVALPLRCRCAAAAQPRRSHRAAAAQPLPDGWPIPPPRVIYWKDAFLNHDAIDLDETFSVASAMVKEYRA
jgi:hypothetical protein